MQRATWIPLALAVGAFLGSAGQTLAGIDIVQITNLTASSGVHNVPYTDSDFPVATDVTFTGLSLELDFADSTKVSESLYDSHNVAQTSLGSILSSGGDTLSTAPFDTSAHGGLVNETLGFTFPTDTVNVYTAPLPSTTTASTSGASRFYLEARGLSTGGSFDLYVADSNVDFYNVGTLSLLEAPNTATPEPSSFLLFGMAVTGLGVARWRKRKQAA